MKSPQPCRPTSSRNTGLIRSVPPRRAPPSNSLKLLRQARERLGAGLRAIQADHIAESDEISLRNEHPRQRTS